MKIYDERNAIAKLENDRAGREPFPLTHDTRPDILADDPFFFLTKHRVQDERPRRTNRENDERANDCMQTATLHNKLSEMYIFVDFATCQWLRNQSTKCHIGSWKIQFDTQTYWPSLVSI